MFIPQRNSNDKQIAKTGYGSVVIHHAESIEHQKERPDDPNQTRRRVRQKEHCSGQDVKHREGESNNDSFRSVHGGLGIFPRNGHGEDRAVGTVRKAKNHADNHHDGCRDDDARHQGSSSRVGA